MDCRLNDLTEAKQTLVGCLLIDKVDGSQDLVVHLFGLQS